MSGGDNGAYNGDDGDYVGMTEGQIAEKKEFINHKFSGIIQRTVDFYLRTLKKLNGLEGISYIGLTAPEPYIGMSESGAELNFILEIEKMGLVAHKTQREGEAGVYRFTYKIAEEYCEAMKDLLEELSL